MRRLLMPFVLALLALAARPAAAETLRCTATVESDAGMLFVGVIQEDGAPPKVAWAGLHLAGGNAAKPNINVYFTLPDSTRPVLGPPLRIAVGAMVDVDASDPRPLTFELRIDGASWRQAEAGAPMAPVVMGQPAPTRSREYQERSIVSQDDPAAIRAYARGRTIGARVGYDGSGEFGDRTLPLPSNASLQPLVNQAFARASALLAGPERGCDWQDVILIM